MLHANPTLILIELNEINFDVVRSYTTQYPGKFPGLKNLLKCKLVHSTSEEKYDQLEPWIQWVSAHSGLTYEQHGVFRLGDIVGTKVPQIFEKLERSGFSVGAVSAMNAENRLRKPCYFIPDPWTSTPPDDSWWSRALTEAVSQAVNDNAQARITKRSLLQLLLSFARFARLRSWSTYLRLLTQASQAPWNKALILDLLLHDVHMTLLKKRAPEFSTLFLNAGAHIQHHYFLNAAPLKSKVKPLNPEWYVPASKDPVADMLLVYDAIIQDYLQLSNSEVIVSTGLSQTPYDQVKFYYRLRNHEQFLRSIGLREFVVAPRMTRDFLVSFMGDAEARRGAQLLSSILVEGERLFGSIDNRGESLFVTLTYPREITTSTVYEIGTYKSELAPHVVFVAIKNGMHQGKGYSFFTDRIAQFAPEEHSHIKNLHDTIVQYFGIDRRAT